MSIFTKHFFFLNQEVKGQIIFQESLLTILCTWKAETQNDWDQLFSLLLVSSSVSFSFCLRKCLTSCSGITQLVPEGKTSSLFPWWSGHKQNWTGFWKTTTSCSAIFQQGESGGCSYKCCDTWPPLWCRHFITFPCHWAHLTQSSLCDCEWRSIEVQCWLFKLSKSINRNPVSDPGLLWIPQDLALVS